MELIEIISEEQRPATNSGKSSAKERIKSTESPAKLLKKVAEELNILKENSAPLKDPTMLKGKDGKEEEELSLRDKLQEIAPERATTKIPEEKLDGEVETLEDLKTTKEQDKEKPRGMEEEILMQAKSAEEEIMMAFIEIYHKDPTLLTSFIEEILELYDDALALMWTTHLSNIRLCIINIQSDSVLRKQKTTL